jgi:two-component system OmpR family response regulator
MVHAGRIGLGEHFRCGLVIVTRRGDSVDKVVGLKVGADDCVTKPFDLRELVARIKAVLRRLAPVERVDSAGVATATAAPVDRVMALIR